MPDPETRSSRILDLFGVILLVAGVAATVTYFEARVSGFDEGGLLTNAYLHSLGQQHHRDFYSIYPPGITLLIRLSWELLGVSVTAARVLGFFLHLILAIGAGFLAGRAAGRRFSWFSAGAVLLWISPLGVVPMAWIAALAAAVWALHSLSGWVEDNARKSALLTGMLLGAVAAFRHDLFVYLSLSLAPLGILGMLRNGQRGRVSRSALWLLAGCILVSLPVWLPPLSAAGPVRVAQDLYFDQVNHVVSGRRLPLEPLGPDLSLWYVTVGMELVAPLLGACILIGSRHVPTSFVPSLLLVSLSLAVIPQLMGRSEWAHVVQTVVPGLCLVGVLIEQVARSPLSRWAVLAVPASVMLLIPGCSLLRVPAGDFQWPQLDFSERVGGVPAWQYQSKVGALNFIAANSGPNDPIFVGNSQHRLVTYNDHGLYYLAARRGATRHMAFEPGLTNSERVQREIIRDLELRRPTVAVLLEGGYVPEPNTSSTPGPALLDEYLRSRYRLVARSGDYHLLLRQEIAAW